MGIMAYISLTYYFMNTMIKGFFTGLALSVGSGGMVQH